MARRRVKNGEKSPWGQCLTQFQTVAAVLTSDWCQKACVFLANEKQEEETGTRSTKTTAKLI